MFNMNRALFLAGMRLGISEAVAMIQSPPIPGRNQPLPPKRGFHRNRTTWHRTNGERECARRRRQIVCGQLKAENGLVR